MKKMCLIIMVFALLFNTQVNYAATPDSTGIRDTVSPVELKSSHQISYKQDSDIEIDMIRNNKEVVMVFDSSSAMNEDVKNVNSPFDYALFSGSEDQDLSIQSGDVLINGSVHTNKSIFQKAGSITVNGKLEAVGEIDTSTVVGNVEFDDKASVVEMQDLSDKFKKASLMKSTLFSTEICTDPILNPDGTKKWYDLILKNSDETGNIKDDSFYVKNGAGKKKYLYCGYPTKAGESWVLTGEEIALVDNKPLYFDGDLQISVNKISGKGFIVATGNISFSTSNFDSDDIGIYSVNGDVNFSVGSTELTGLIYAPKGTVNINTSKVTVVGSVVGKNIVTGNGKIDITYNGELGSVKQIKVYEEIERTISVAKTVAQNFIKRLKEEYSKSDIKLNFVTYTDKAVAAYAESYDITANDLDATDSPYSKIDYIELGSQDANLGDGLRLAYYLLTKSKDTASDKYMVVFSADNPNSWTKNNDTSLAEEFKLDEGLALDSQIMKGDVAKAIRYSKEIAGMFKASKIKSFFVDVNSGSTLNDINDIATAGGAEFYNPEPDPDPAKKIDFGKALTTRLVKDIADIVLNDESYTTPKVTVSFTEELPDEVAAIEFVDFDIGTSAKELVLKSIDKVIVTPIEDENKIKLTLGDINIKVKYNDFGKTDGFVRYKKIQATYTISNPNSGDLVGNKYVDIDQKDVKVLWSKDIN